MQDLSKYTESIFLNACHPWAASISSRNGSDRSNGSEFLRSNREFATVYESREWSYWCENSHLCGRLAEFLDSPPIDPPHEFSDPLLLGVCAHNPPPLHNEALGKQQERTYILTWDRVRYWTTVVSTWMSFFRPCVFTWRREGCSLHPAPAACSLRHTSESWAWLF